MLAQVLVSLALLLNSYVLANPIVIRDSPVTLPFAKRYNTTGTPHLLKIDQARAKTLRIPQAERERSKFSSAASSGVPSTNQAVDYVVTVGVGNPPTEYKLLVDTGSSNTWIGAAGPQVYKPTPNAVDTHNSLYIEYGSGLVSGEEWIDDLTIAPGMTITNQSLGVALIAIGFDDSDGILGIGPEVLTYSSLFPNATTYVPTVTQNLYSQGFIQSRSVGISFAPSPSKNISSGVANGELMFGGVDESKYTGSINYVPLTTTYPSIYYVGINQTVSYGSSAHQAKTLLNNTAGITDTGTTLLLIASDAFATYQELTGAEIDPDIGLLRLTNAQYTDLESLFFTIGEQTYEFTSNAQIWPRALNSAIGGTSDYVYLIVGDIGTDSGVGMDFINGMSFLERFYSVYDTDNNRFGISTTQFTSANTN